MTSTTTAPIAHDPTRDEPPPLAPGLHPRRESAVFVALTAALIVALALVMPGTKANPGPVSLLTMMCPAIVVGLVRLASRLRHGPANPYPLGMRRAGLRFWPAAVLVPAAAMAFSFGAADALGVVSFDGLGLYLLDAPISIVIMTVLVLGEEIGWRSYLLPRLASVMPVRRAALVTGFIQGTFHMPLVLLTPGYDGDGSRWLVVPGVLMTLTAAGPLFGWLRVRSGSLWPAAIAHGTVNTLIIEAPTLVTKNPDLAAYLTAEAGIFTILSTALIAIVILRKANWTPRPSKADRAQAEQLGPRTELAAA